MTYSIEMSQAQNRTARIEARITPDALKMVKRAAKLQGRSLSDFVVTTIEAAAKKKIAAKKNVKDRQVLLFSPADQERISELLLNPPKPNAALKRAFAAHKRLIRQSK